MSAAPGAELLALARAEVNRACNLLIAPTPEALIGVEDALERAVSALRDFRSACREVQAGPGDHVIVRALRAEVLRASRLLQNLAGFYRGWDRILGAMSGGYTASGNPAPVARRGRLCCRV
jgi:hypothetical protein